LERDGETLLQFAAVYGFRNIQTLVQRIRKGRVPYQLVEVLSCPGGEDPPPAACRLAYCPQYSPITRLTSLKFS